MKLCIQGIPAVYQGPAYLADTEEGPQGVFDSFAGVTTVDGKDWHHYLPFRSSRDQRLLDLLAGIRAAGVIDTDHWVELEPVTSLEDRLAIYAEAEAEMRAGLRADNDYHDAPVR